MVLMKGKNRDTFEVRKVKTLLDMSVYWTQPENQKERVAAHDIRFWRVLRGYKRIDRILKQTKNN
jgi:hypothetical protein